MVVFSTSPIWVYQSGTAESLTAVSGGAYPTIRDSLYIDLNVKYAK